MSFKQQETFINEIPYQTLPKNRENLINKFDTI